MNQGGEAKIGNLEQQILNFSARCSIDVGIPFSMMWHGAGTGVIQGGIKAEFFVAAS